MIPILLATREHHKLSPIFGRIPAPMIPMGNKPVMAHMVDLLAAQGFKEILVCLHQMGGSIDAYFGTGQRWGVTLNYILQRDALGTAGSLKWAERYLNETFLVMQADIIIDLNITDAAAFHLSHGRQATRVVDSTTINEKARIGIYIFEPEVLQFIPPFGVYDIHTQLVPAIRDAGLQVQDYLFTGFWSNLETFHDYHKTQRTFLNRISGQHKQEYFFPNRPSVRGRQLEHGVWISSNTSLHSSARLTPPVYIGSNCRIGRGVEIGPDVVIGENVIIDDDASIIDSTVCNDTYIGKLVRLDSRLVHKNLVVDIPSGEHFWMKDDFLLHDTGRVISKNLFIRVFEVLVGLMAAFFLLPGALLICLPFWFGGGVFSKKIYVKPIKPVPGEQENLSIKTFTLLNFNTSQQGWIASKVGRAILRWKLERLPELLSVIRGDLSLIGVKPLSLMESSQLTQAWQKNHLEQQPGFTGLWFIRINHLNDLNDILVTDAYYAATRNWREDLKILGQTPLAWLETVRLKKLGGQ